MTLSIEKINPRHAMILDLYLKGWKAKDISGHFDMTLRHVSVLINSPNFQHELSLRRAKIEEMSDHQLADVSDDVTKELRAGALAAAKKLVNNIDTSDNEAICLRSATEILDRTGHPKRQVIDNNPSVQIVISPDDANRIVESINLDNEPAETESSD